MDLAAAMLLQGSSALEAALEQHKDVSVDTTRYERECETRKQAYCTAWLGGLNWTPWNRSGPCGCLVDSLGSPRGRDGRRCKVT